MCDWPNPPKEAPSAAWPRYMKNAATRDHISGKKLSFTVLKVELERLGVVWRRVQAQRQRDAIYDFIEAAFDLVSKFNRAGNSRWLLKKLHRLDRRLKRIHEPYSAVIHFVTDHSVDSRTRSKWSRLMRFAERTKKRGELLEDFIRRNGGINECALAN
jgi:3-methyladenine DNA glycosylase/8-oxoguanine DNA glycosylase